MLGRKLVIGGGVLAAFGVLVWALERRKQGLGRVVGVEKRNGMTVKHHRGAMDIKERAGLIQDLVWDSVKNPEMRQLALAITGEGRRQVQVRDRVFDVQGANCPARDGMCEAKAVYNWVRKNVRYAGDIAPIKQGRRGVVEGVDYFAAADRVVQFGAEDCDGHSILNATLLALNGIPAKLRITAPGRFREWSHIYTVAGMPKTAPKKWVALDTTLPGEYFGVEAPHGRVRDFDA